MKSAHLSQSKSISWKAVVILLVLFWPVGLVLLCMKMGQDKSVTFQSSKTVGIVGWVLIAMAAFYLLGGLTGNLDTSSGGDPVFGMIAATVLFGGGGVCLLFVSRRMKANARKYRKYIDLVINQEQTSLDNIAAAMALPYEIVRRDLQKMIDIGYFAGAYIHDTDREIVKPRPAPAEETPEAVVQETAAMKATVCPGCGARNVIPAGRTVPCEYCGTPLS